MSENPQKNDVRGDVAAETDIELNSDVEADEILIRASAKRNGMTSFFIGAGLLFLAVSMFQVLPAAFNLLAIFTTSAGIVALMIGWFKIREPGHSLRITRNLINYQHRKGVWQLEWDNIQRIDIPKVTRGIEQTELSLVGIKIKDYTPLLNSISPRLATNMLMEQRPLLLQVPDKNCDSGTCYSADMIEDDRFKDQNGNQYRGVIAMFGNRMKKLRERLGYDLFINSAELDRNPSEFVTLMRDCQASVMRQNSID